MSWIDDLPIRRKITAIIMLTCSVSMILACVVLAAYERLDARANAERDATVLADTLCANAQAALTFDDLGAARKLMNTLAADPDVLAARLWRGDQPFADYIASPEQGGGSTQPATRPQMPLLAKLKGALMVERPITLDGRRIGSITMEVSLQGVHDRLMLFAFAAVAVLLPALGLAFVLSSRLQRPISGPILSLADVARLVAERNDYSLRAPPGGRDELGRLTEDFNHMLEQISKHADHLAAINAELEQFAYITSHDLKEPLRMVTLYMGILDRQLGPKLDDKQREYLGYAVQGAGRMQTLIADLLAFTRTSQIIESHQPVDLNQVLQEVRATFQLQIQQLGAKLEVGDLPTIYGERTKLALVFQNLIGNALKFHAQDQSPEISVSARPIGNEYDIMVKDNVIGITPAYLELIFGVFQRLHGREQYPGNGMGLAISRKIVEQHHGHLRVVSKEGEGATFIVRLPASTRSDILPSIQGPLASSMRSAAAAPGPPAPGPPAPGPSSLRT